MIIISLIILFLFLIIGHVYNAEVMIAPIFGIMIGALYSYSDFEEGREHTLQFCFFFISFTIVWIIPPDGLK